MADIDARWVVCGRIRPWAEERGGERHRGCYGIAELPTFDLWRGGPGQEGRNPGLSDGEDGSVKRKLARDK